MGRKRQFDNEICSCCNQSPATISGMCTRCYGRVHYRKGKNIPLNAPKYSSLQRKTFDSVIALSKTDSMTQSQMARVCGVSRQRVNQIIKKYKKESESA